MVVSQLIFIGIISLIFFFTFHSFALFIASLKHKWISHNHDTTLNADVAQIIDPNTHPIFDAHYALPCVYIGSPKKFSDFHWLILFCNITIELVMNPKTKQCRCRKRKLTSAKDIEKLIETHFLVNVGTSTKSLQQIASYGDQLIVHNPKYDIGSWDCQSFAWYGKFLRASMLHDLISFYDLILNFAL